MICFMIGLSQMRVWVCALLTAVSAVGARLELTIVSGAGPVPARVHVCDAAGQSYLPEGTVAVPVGPDRWFVSDGQVRLDVPAGVVRVHVERGPEYQPVREDIRVSDVARRKITLRRWIDMRARGYTSGENHLHVPAADLGAMLAAEDLDFGNSLHWWNDKRLLLPSAAHPVMTLSFAGHAAPTTIFDAEVENAWGAVYLTGLKRPMPIPWNRARSNLPYVRLAREQGALISYQGGWSREVLLDALLGLVDVVNICNNNFHRFNYQPRTQYSNLLDVPGFPQYPNTPEGMMRMNTDTWYRLLNCGLRLAAGAESATGAKATPAGYNRAYVRTGANSTLEQFLGAWRQGRNFVTNGPMVLLNADGGREPGDTIALPAGGGTVRLDARALSDDPLRSLEIVVNGKVAGRAMGTELVVAVKIREGAWIAARATAEDRLLSDQEMQRFQREGKNVPAEAPCRLRFGHTSPIYVTVGGTGVRVAQSLAEARQMLETFERWARNNAEPGYLREVLDACIEARRALE